jgi:hypothetical protein
MKVAGAGMDKMFPGTDKKPSLWKQYREAYKEYS